MNQVVLKDPAGPGWLLFQEPGQVIQAWQPGQVLPALRQLETAVEAEGLYAAGFISYEAAPAFDSALQVRPDGGFPLLWFGLYPAPRREALLPSPAEAPPAALAWSPSVNRDEYDRAIARVKDYIARGDTYQVNFTLRLRAPFVGDAWELFLRLVQAQPTPYSAYLDIGPFVVCSASPELFFQLDGDLLTARPMKGTAARGRTLAEDQEQASWLQRSQKDRAENVMIVDMLRNDLGRVAQVGSVTVPSLFQVERYPTLWQMTSTIQARSPAPLSEILKAVFPCASITGAPKPRTMRIISALETAPRRVYTGCIGYYAPGRQARFSVAIRTVLVDRQARQAEYGTGGGIVWDSTSAGEYAECLLKAVLVAEKRPDFSLLETMRWTDQEGFYLLEEHIHRLGESAEYFGFPLDLSRLCSELESLASRQRMAGKPPPSARVRLLLDSGGEFTFETFPLAEPPNARPLHLGVAPKPVDSASPFLYHKTTHRQAYQEALAACPSCDDVVLWNERREVTETCIANLVYQLNGQLFTPPAACGLLPGTLRARLLAQGQVQERVLALADLAACEKLFVINSVRGWQEAILAGAG